MKFLRALLPSCSHCSSPSFSFLCQGCFDELKFSDACAVCGCFSAVNPCLSCSGKSRSWKNLSVGFKYEGGLREFILDIKDHGKPERIGELEAKHLPKLKGQYDFIVYAASDPIQTKARLFDSTRVLAERLSRLWKVPLLEDIFDRKVFLKSQKELHLETRKKYLKRIISLSSLASVTKDKNLLFIDDIMTTGATLEVHLKLLLGLARSVDVFCLARTLKV